MKYNVLWNSGDYCLRASLYMTGKLFKRQVWASDRIAWDLMIKECRLRELFGHRKSKEYTWEKDIHNGKKSLRCRLWKLICWITKKDITLYCGLNCDQYRALLIPLYMTRRSKTSRHIAKNIFWGYILRCGFSPSLTEWAVIKPQSLILLLRMFWYSYPLYLAALPFLWLSIYRNIKLKKISDGTTNKISLLPTMMLLGYKIPEMDYIENVYQTYFSKSDVVGQAMIGGFGGLRAMSRS